MAALPDALASDDNNDNSPINTAATGQKSSRKGNLKMVTVVNARSVRNGWGVNANGDPAKVAAALTFIGTRWIRYQFDGDTSAGLRNFQAALVAGNHPDPNLKVQLLLNDYIQNAQTNSWNNQQNWILNSVLPIKGQNGRTVLAAIEGPNEMNTMDGNGARGPNDTQDKTGGSNVSSDNPTANANFVDWAKQLSSFRQSHSTQLQGVEILSPTILYFYVGNWSNQLNVSQYVDYGTFHYYSGLNGTTGVPSYPPNPCNFEKMYHFAQAGICPGKPLVQSEGGASSQVGGGGYAQDGRSIARYQVMQVLDHHAVGGHRYMIYNLFNNPASGPNNVTNWNEDNFGLFYGDGTTPKGSAISLHNMSNLLSLNNNWSDPANVNDTQAFNPAYNGQGFSVDGIQNAGTAGYSLMMPKSDGTTMIAVWNEPPIDDGSGTSLNPSPNNITVNFGSSQTYKVYDVLGAGNNVAGAPSVNLTPIKTGSGSSVQLTLVGNPLFIEIGTKGSIAPVKKVQESTPGTTVTDTKGIIGDKDGNSWTLVGSAGSYQVAVNGVTDSTTSKVVSLTYVNKQVWQKNVNNMYWGKTDPSATWLPTNGQSSLPTQLQPSKDGTTITKASDSPVIDNNLNSWSLVNGQNGLQVAVNGTADTTTSQVIALGVFGGKIWQENTNKMWWSKASPGDAWGPDGGTSTAPTAPTSPTTQAIDTTAMQASIKQEVSALQNALATAKDQNAVKAAITALNAALTALQAVT
jgi:hypothetical protein